MNPKRDTNPHFIDLEFPHPAEQTQRPRHGSSSTYHFPAEPQPRAPPRNIDHQPPKIHSGSTPLISTEQHISPQPTPHPTTQHNRPLHHNPSVLRVPTVRKTKPIAWLIAAFCALFWIIIIVGGLIVLIIYLVFKPRSPRFDITSVSLNAAYLDTGYLLNGDLSVLANFTNANRKVTIDFSYVVMDLYFAGNFIATTYVDPLSVMSGQSRFQVAHFTPSQVRLSVALSQELQRQMNGGRVRLEIRGVIKAKSKLGGIFRYSYWLYSRCDITVTSPPNGVMLGHHCETKRVSRALGITK